MKFNIFKITVFINLYGLLKIPLLFFVTPRVVEISKYRFVVKIPLNFRTQNHLKSMYFGAMGIGAELSVAAAAVKAIADSNQKIDFIFKEFSAQYLKRADGDVHFICEEVSEVRNLIDRAVQSPERVEGKFRGYATVPSSSEKDIVMSYELTLSVKNRGRKN